MPMIGLSFKVAVLCLSRDLLEVLIVNENKDVIASHERHRRIFSSV